MSTELTVTLTHAAGTAPKRDATMKAIKETLNAPLPGQQSGSSTLERDERIGDDLVASAVTVDSWTRIASWSAKFKAYAMKNCPNPL